MTTINSIGVSLSAEKDETRLIETVLSGAQAVFNADGAALYLLSKDGRLELSLAHVTSLSLWLRGPAAGAARRRRPRAGRMGRAAAAAGATERTIVAAPDVYAAAQRRFRAPDRLRPADGLPLAVLRERAAPEPRERGDRDPAAGQRPVAKHGRDRCPSRRRTSGWRSRWRRRRRWRSPRTGWSQDFKGLFEGLTELISTAIDEQSPHTGGHVRRVVVLSRMIAEAMPRSASGALRDRALSEDELYELQDRGPAARLREADDARAHDGQGHEAAGHRRPHAAGRSPRGDRPAPAADRAAGGGHSRPDRRARGSRALRRDRRGGGRTTTASSRRTWRSCAAATRAASARPMTSGSGCAGSAAGTPGPTPGARRESLLSDDEMHHLARPVGNADRRGTGDHQRVTSCPPSGCWRGCRTRRTCATSPGTRARTTSG